MDNTYYLPKSIHTAWKLLKYHYPNQSPTSLERSYFFACRTACSLFGVSAPSAFTGYGVFLHFRNHNNPPMINPNPITPPITPPIMGPLLTDFLGLAGAFVADDIVELVAEDELKEVEVEEMAN